MSEFRPPLTTALMLAQLRRLHDVWPKYDANTKTFERLAVEFKEALSDYDADVVEGATSLWLREGGRFPAPSQLREMATRWITHNRVGRTAPLTEDFPGCKVCRQPPRWAVLSCVDSKTGQPFSVDRMIQPCDRRLHSDGQYYVPYPPNFVRWAPPPPEAPSPHVPEQLQRQRHQIRQEHEGREDGEGQPRPDPAGNRRALRHQPPEGPSDS